MDNLLAAAGRAEVGHAAILSIVGAERVPDLVYYRAKAAAHGDQRTVVTDDSAGMFAAAPGDALIADDNAVIAKTSYREWLAR
jgi:hypothetical protein